MPRDSSGNYTLPTGNPVVTGTVVESDWANTTLSDVQVALTDSLDRNGRGGMLSPFRVVDGTPTTPGLAFVQATGTGFSRVSGNVHLSFAGVSSMVFTPTQMTINGELVLTDAPRDGLIYGRQDGQWVEVAASGAAGSGVDVGALVGFSGAVPNAGTEWLVCDGQAVSRAAFPDLDALYSAAGYPWGSGDGSTTFNVPDLRGRALAAVGQGDTAEGGGSGTLWALADATGAETHTLTVDEIPSHGHTQQVSTADGGMAPGAPGNGISGGFGAATGQAGNDQPHNILGPRVHVNFAVRAIPATPPDTTDGTYDRVQNEGATETSIGRRILEFRDNGNATVAITDDGPGDRTIIDIGATGGGGSGTLNNVTDGTTASAGRGTIRFQATGDASVAVSDNAGGDESIVTISAVAAGGGYTTIQDSGVSVAQESTIDFTLGISAAPGVGKTNVFINPAEIAHDALASIPVNDHIDHSTVDLTAGAGLTAGSGGDITASRTFAVGAGTGIQVNANDVQVDATVQRQIGSPTNGNLVAMDGSGNVTDGGELVADLPTINRTDDPTGPVRFAVVATLPGSPDANTVYFVTS